MSAEKRSASNSFSTSQLVKRQKSNVDLGGVRAVTVTNTSAENGALTHAVGRPFTESALLSESVLNSYLQEGPLMQRFE